jgi:hypothetical protein
MQIAFLILSVLLNLNTQEPKGDTSTCEERARQVLQSLEPDNSLRRALEQGQRGDCVRKLWMDKMRQLGVKQVSFLVEYSWKKGEVNFKIKGASYSKHYYTNYDADIIKDRKLLRAVRESGLEQELRDALLQELRTSVFAKRRKDQVARDKFLANLLDDEALPVLDIIF